MKKETHGVFSRGAGGLLASCLFFSFLMTLCGLPCLGIQKSLLNGSCNYKGKAHLIPLLGFVIIFRLEKHFWTHPMLLKYFFFTFTTISGIFWCLIIQRLYALYFFSWFMLFASITLLDMTKNPSCILALHLKCPHMVCLRQFHLQCLDRCLCLLQDLPRISC